MWLVGKLKPTTHLSGLYIQMQHDKIDVNKREVAELDEVPNNIQRICIGKR